MKAKKRRLGSVVSEEKSDDTESALKEPHGNCDRIVDPFSNRFGCTLTPEQCEQLKKPKSQKPQKNIDFSSLGSVVEFAGVAEEVTCLVY